ncbi:MAG: ParA family protein [Planctomycetia bacterium]|nr:ParA family protein [Planctomycetia bacterium]
MPEKSHSLNDQITQLKAAARQLEENSQEVKRLVEQMQSATSPAENESYRNDILKAIAWKIRNHGSVWTQTSARELDSLPRFIPVEERPLGMNNVSMRIVAFINFKGGVGKTTITANLAAALANGVYYAPNNDFSAPRLRTLVVDLDFQQTLTDRCLSLNDLSDLRGQQEARHSASLLKVPKLPEEQADYTKLSESVEVYAQLHAMTRNFIDARTGYVLPSKPSLDDEDTIALIKLLMDHTEARFFYRCWFHNKTVMDNYDMVVFDCPPRQTASTINALIASDYVFIPANPSSFDFHAIVHTVDFLCQLKDTFKLPLKIGGIVLNRTQQEGKITNQERSIMNTFPSSLKRRSRDSKPLERYLDEYGIPPFFENFIPKRTGIGSIIGESGAPLPAGTRDPKFSFFKDVASEFVRKVYQ